MPVPNSVKVHHTHHAHSYRVSFHAKLRFVSQTKRAGSLLRFLRVINADAEVLRLAVCKLYPARYGRVMTVSLSSCTQQVVAVDFSQPRGISCLGWSRQEHIWHGMISRCKPTVFTLPPITCGVTLYYCI